MSDGAVQTVRAFPDAPRQAHVEFPAEPGPTGWYALIVEDGAGRKAYSDPIWTAVSVH